MADSVNLEVLSTRSGFNTAVRHIRRTMEINASTSDNNLGGILQEIEDEEMTSARVGLLLRMLLIDKLGYKTASTNLRTIVEDIGKLSAEFEKWHGVDLIAAYYHPEMGLLIANPKVPEELAGFGQLRKRELLVMYAGFMGQDVNDDCQKAASLAASMFEGAKVTVPPALLKGKFVVKKPKPKKAPSEPVKAKQTKTKTAAKPAAGAKPAAKAAAAVAPAPAKPAGGPVKMTPRYAVVVSNELFHNGNVEAWKRIVASYKAKHPNLEVFITTQGSGF